MIVLDLLRRLVAWVVGWFRPAPPAPAPRPPPVLEPIPSAAEKQARDERDAARVEQGASTPNPGKSLRDRYPR